MKKNRILATILCIFTVIGTVCAPISQASAYDEARTASTPRWVNTATITLDMKFSNSTITSEGQILGNAGTTDISVNFTLEKLNGGKYNLVDSWAASNNAMYCTSSRKTTNCTTGTYKLTVSGTVTKNNYAEPIELSMVKTF